MLNITDPGLGWTHVIYVVININCNNVCHSFSIYDPEFNKCDHSCMSEKLSGHKNFINNIFCAIFSNWTMPKWKGCYNY